MTAAPLPVDVPGQHVTNLTEGWLLSVSDSDACAAPAEAARLEDWIPACVPGTAAQALEAAGRWSATSPTPLHDMDIWYRVALPAAGLRTLRFDGLATLAQVWIDDRLILASEAMFESHEVDVEIQPGATLWLCFRALAGRLAAKNGRGRWRARLVDRQNLRGVRTTLLGHIRGWRPAIDVVGPWRPVRLIERGTIRLDGVCMKADWSESGAILEASVVLRGAAHAPVLSCAGASVTMGSVAADQFRGRLEVPDAQPWWPHTHGEQALYDVMLGTPEGHVTLGRTGFRRIALDRGEDGRGFGLTVNGIPIFARGACWIAPDAVALSGGRGAYEPTLELAREAGMNMIRVNGMGVYETRAFYDVADELGLLVWQDFMFANLDYPGDPEFLASARREAESVLAGLQGAPSLAVLCGGSEVMQQAAMMGLPPLEWPLFDQVLADVAERLRPDVVYVPNTPHGGAAPMTVSEGVGHYYGVGAYERPLEDARRANVRFAAECLAFANIPQPELLAQHLPVVAVHDPRWKAVVPRDRGASWDFDDVRDHYLERLFARDPYRLRREDPDLYLDLSRAVSGEVMSAVFSEWRRAESPCSGGLVWMLRDIELGAGWGLIDATGEPKPAWYALKRILQPVSVTITDEGLNGLSFHLINERPQSLAAKLTLSAFAEAGAMTAQATREVALPPRSIQELSDLTLLGRFADLNYAYRFGRRAHDAVHARLETLEAGVVAEAMLFLRPDVGLHDGEVSAELVGGGDVWRVILTSERLLRYVHISDMAFRPLDDGFSLAPGMPRTVTLAPRAGVAAGATPSGEVLGAGGHVLGGYASCTPVRLSA